jgi:hypothetical protein
MELSGQPHTPVALPLEQYPMDRRLDGSQTEYVYCRKEKDFGLLEYEPGLSSP